MQARTDLAAGAMLWQTFVDKARQLGATIERAAGEAAAAELVLRAGAGAPAGTRGLAEGFPEVAARCGPLPDPEAAAPEVVAAGALAVAETGSVLLAEDTRDRGACFLAEHLWLLVRTDDVVATLDVALERVRELVGGGAHHVVLMSGPSRTADIERTLTIGVHGPGRLTIVAVGDGEGAT